MAGIKDVSIVNSNTAEAKAVEAGIQKTLCSPELCSSKHLTVYKQTILPGKQWNLQAGNDYDLVYVMKAPAQGVIYFGNESHPAEEGAGVLLVPGESAVFETSGSDLELLHLIVAKPPTAVDEGLPGGPGYFFNRKMLRSLSDASGGRVRRFCAESSVRFPDGRRLTLTNAVQAGEMHYHEGGSSPYHFHKGTSANPDGPDHCYITFKGRGLVEVGNESQEIEPGTLIYFPPGVPHRLRSHGGPLDYFEIQAWRGFKTTILSEEPLGLKWYYERQNPNDQLLEWNQS